MDKEQMKRRCFKLLAFVLKNFCLSVLHWLCRAVCGATWGHLTLHTFIATDFAVLDRTVLSVSENCDCCTFESSLLVFDSGSLPARLDQVFTFELQDELAA